MEKTYSIVSFNLMNFVDEVAEPLRSKITACVFKNGSVIIYLSETIAGQELLDLDAYVAGHDPTPASPFRVMPYVKDEFIGYEINSIDFKRHLKDDTALDKEVIMMANGRPEKCTYTLAGVEMAQIRFDIVDNGVFMVTRKEFVSYYREDGTLGPEAIIKSRTYDHTKEFDLSEVIDERVGARKYLVKAMKGYLSGVLMQALQKSMAEVIAIVTPYWDSAQIDREHFEELATTDWATSLDAIDLATTPHTYLAIDLGGGLTIRDWMKSKITY